MTDDGLLKICAIGLLAAVVSVLLRAFKSDVHFALKLGGCVLVFGGAVVYIERFMDEISAKLAIAGGEEYLNVMMRCLGIAIITEITATICRECGENGISEGVELAGRFEILLLALPVISRILDSLGKLLSMSR
jgi:stage III sporulation protein AD